MADGVKRRLTTILAADVSGYSRLIAKGDERTVALLRQYRETIDDLIARHHGQIFSTAGDSVMSEFPSAVEAVRCALEIQEELAARNAELPDDRAMRFRLGICVGDVIAEDDDLHGDGVNIAARLESLAEPDGILISGSVHEQVKSKVSVEFEDAGPQTVKNIPDPVQVYAAKLPSSAPSTPATKANRRTVAWKLRAVAAAAVVVLAVAAVGVWQGFFAAKEALAKPSIAILPFTNMSGDKSQDYFSDGLAEDLITQLAQNQNLLVIARHSSFSYKGKPVKIAQVATELGARYVLEGSVRKSNGTLRITAQLIDANSGGHIFAQKFDRTIRTKQLFVLQDELSLTISKKLLRRVSLTEPDRRRCGTEKLEAFEKYLQGHSQYYRFDIQNQKEAIRYLEEAIKLDLRYPAALALLAETRIKTLRFGWARGNRRATIKNAQRMAAQSANQDCFMGYRAAAMAHTATGELDKAIESAKTALSLNPSDPESLAVWGRALMYQGKAEDAIDKFQLAKKLDPKRWHFTAIEGVAHYMAENYETAKTLLRHVLDKSRSPVFPKVVLCAAFAKLNATREAKTCADETKIAIRESRSRFTVERFTNRLGRSYKDVKGKEYVERLKKGMIDAGLPTGAPPEPSPRQ